MKPQSGGALLRKQVTGTDMYAPGPGAAHGLRVGQMVFTGQQSARNSAGAVMHPGDVTAQTGLLLDHLESTLSDLGTDLADVVRLNLFYDLETPPDAWRACLSLLAQRFGDGGGPALTAVPLPRMFPAGAMLTLSAWAMRGADGKRLEMRRTPGNRTEVGPLLWRQTVACGDMIFAGGLSSFQDDGRVANAGDHIAQTTDALEAMAEQMSAFGASLADVHKTNSYYVLHTVDQFNANLQLRSDRFSKPGPGSVGLPLDALGTEGQAIEIEAIGILK
jgi:enamine deaminase RidA (YjgF/YER057c/UK114 family)